MIKDYDIELFKHDLLQENERLRQRVGELDAFAETIAHDLKNPLATIRGFASLIQDYQERLSYEDINATAGHILEETQKLEEMIDSMLLFSRVNNLDSLEISVLDMHEIVENASIKLRTLITQSGAHLTIPIHWPEVTGYGPWVEHIWMNYMSNAIKYGGDPPEIELGTCPAANGWVAFWVRDNGNGLTPDEQKTVFEPFTRLKQHTTHGHGLGLTIAMRIVEKLGGEVGVNSTLGIGSTFRFTLPAASYTGY